MKHQSSTHFQPYEKLLIGWIMGAAWLEYQVCRDDKDEIAAQHPPPTTASPCLQGGMGANGPVTISITMLGKKGEGREGRRQWWQQQWHQHQHQHQNQHQHCQCRTGWWWGQGGDNNAHGTRALCYKQLLIGRKAGAYGWWQREGDQQGSTMMTVPPHHHCKQLLAGWMGCWGGDTMECWGGDKIGVLRWCNGVLTHSAMQHIAKLHCTKWYDLSNTYIVSNDTGSVDAIEHSMYICTYYSNKWVHCYSASVHIPHV